MCIIWLDKYNPKYRKNKKYNKFTNNKAIIKKIHKRKETNIIQALNQRKQNPSRESGAMPVPARRAFIFFRPCVQQSQQRRRRVLIEKLWTFFIVARGHLAFPARVLSPYNYKRSPPEEMNFVLALYIPIYIPRSLGRVFTASLFLRAIAKLTGRVFMLSGEEERCDCLIKKDEWFLIPDFATMGCPCN